MLNVVIPEEELFDEKNGRFITLPKIEFQIEHCLHSISKWEEKYHKPYLATKDLSYKEYIDYIQFMTITENVDPTAYLRLTQKNFDEIAEYMKDPATATTFTNDKKSSGKHEIMTAEIFYYYMIAFTIPIEFQYWHLNKLMALIRVCDIKNNPPKKRTAREQAEYNRALNETRKKQYNTRG